MCSAGIDGGVRCPLFCLVVAMGGETFHREVQIGVERRLSGGRWKVRLPEDRPSLNALISVAEPSGSGKGSGTSQRKTGGSGGCKLVGLQAR